MSTIITFDDLPNEVWSVISYWRYRFMWKDYVGKIRFYLPELKKTLKNLIYPDRYTLDSDLDWPHYTKQKRVFKSGWYREPCDVIIGDKIIPFKKEYKHKSYRIFTESYTWNGKGPFIRVDVTSVQWISHPGVKLFYHMTAGEFNCLK